MWKTILLIPWESMLTESMVLLLISTKLDLRKWKNTPMNLAPNTTWSRWCLFINFDVYLSLKQIGNFEAIGHEVTGFREDGTWRTNNTNFNFTWDKNSFKNCTPMVVGEVFSIAVDSSNNENVSYCVQSKRKRKSMKKEDDSVIASLGLSATTLYHCTVHYI